MDIIYPDIKIPHVEPTSKPYRITYIENLKKMSEKEILKKQAPKLLYNNIKFQKENQ